MQIKKIDIYDLVIDLDSDKTNLTNIDPVDRGAIERDFITFSKENIQTKFQNNPEKRIATGAVLVPDRLIYRFDEEMNYEYYVRINKENIENAKKVFFRDGNTHNIQLNHSGEKVSGVYVIDSWTVKNPSNDLSNELGFKNVPAGTWFASLYFQNKQIWDEYISTGKLKGFSIQGIFNYQLSKVIDVPVRLAFQKQKEELKKQVEDIQLQIQRKK